MSLVADLIGNQVSIVTCDSRHIVGILRGCDQHTNVVLEKCHERMYTEEGVLQQHIGVYIIKGDNLIAVGELDEELDAKVDLTTLVGETMPPLQH